MTGVYARRPNCLRFFGPLKPSRLPLFSSFCPIFQNGPNEEYLGSDYWDLQKSHPLLIKFEDWPEKEYPGLNLKLDLPLCCPFFSAYCCKFSPRRNLNVLQSCLRHHEILSSGIYTWRANLYIPGIRIDTRRANVCTLNFLQWWARKYPVLKNMWFEPNETCYDYQ